jgi:hypothetical protein
VLGPFIHNRHDSMYRPCGCWAETQCRWLSQCMQSCTHRGTCTTIGTTGNECGFRVIICLPASESTSHFSALCAADGVPSQPTPRATPTAHPLTQPGIPTPLQGLPPAAQ